MRYEIRAMSFGEILDSAFRLVRDHFTLLVGTGAVLYVPYAVLAAVVQRRPQMVASGFGIVSVVVLFLGFIVVSPIVAAAITLAVGEVYLGAQPTVRQCLRSGLAILIPLSGTTLLATLLIIVGLVALVVPGVYMMLAFILMWQVMVFEGKFGSAALRRSRDLMRGNLLRGFGILFLGALIVNVLTAVLQLVLGFIPLLGPVGSGLAQAAGGAYTSAVAVLLYFDIRCRKEAFDIEHLTQLVAAEAPPVAAPTA